MGQNRIHTGHDMILLIHTGHDMGQNTNTHGHDMGQSSITHGTRHGTEY